MGKDRQTSSSGRHTSDGSARGRSGKEPSHGPESPSAEIDQDPRPALNQSPRIQAIAQRQRSLSESPRVLRQAQRLAPLQRTSRVVQRDKGGAKAKAGPWKKNDLDTLVAEKSSEQVIRALAGRDTRNGVKMLLDAHKWDGIVSKLPAGGQLSAETQEAMPPIVHTRLLGFDQLALLFKKRFDRVLTSEQAAELSYDAIVMVWKQLDRLPTADVSETTTLAVISFIQGGAGFYTGKHPGVGGKVELGLAASQEHIEHTVRHEIGHGVHDQLQGVVDTWLRNDIGMWYGELDDDGVDQLIAEIGGYPATYQDQHGVARPFGPSQKQVIRAIVQQYTNYASWDPAPINLSASQRRTMDGVAGLEDTLSQSTSYWYDNYENFHRGAGGNRLFVNHWYHKWFWISDKAKSVIDSTGQNYSAMSEKELFANSYAEYFKDPAGKKDPTKWGGILADEVKQFFAKNVLNRQPYAQNAKRKKYTSK